jgi:CheY-like chemotaxis protein
LSARFERSAERTSLESSPPPLSPQDSALTRALHAARDREESERVRFLGALVAHDLNNALFALSGRLQLLKRRATDPATIKSAEELLASTKLFDQMLSLLHRACPRDAEGNGPSAVRTAITEALRTQEATYPGHLTVVHADLEEIPADLSFEGSSSMIASALAQCLTIHRNRAAARVEIHVEAARDGDAERVTVTLEDHARRENASGDSNKPASAWQSDAKLPSLLEGHLALEMLPLGAAQRAVRDIGGRVTAEPTAHGFRTSLSFLARRGIAMPQSPSLAHGQSDACETGSIPAPSARSVLIADDDPAVRAVLVAALEAVGDDVDTTNDPSSIATRTDLASFDVVILDAGGGGLDALRAIRARGDNTPVLVASGDEVDVGNDPQTAALVKPFPLNVLDRELARLAALRARHRA